MVTNCPPDIHAFVELGTSYKPVSWIEPSAYDYFGDTRLLDVTHSPGHDFPLGITQVSYRFADEFNNTASCTFLVIVNQGKIINRVQLKSGHYFNGL